jgi:hypothetical protein
MQLRGHRQSVGALLPKTRSINCEFAQKCALFEFELPHNSQPVFAHHLHTTASTVRKWEQGETRPAGPALKLLNVIADKGLQAIL